MQTHLATEPDSFSGFDGLGGDFDEGFDGLVVVDRLPTTDDVAQAVDRVGVTNRVASTGIRHETNLFEK